MATNTGDIYLAVEKLKDTAVGAFTHIENAEDLEPLVEQLVAVRDQAQSIMDVTVKVASALAELE